MSDLTQKPIALTAMWRRVEKAWLAILLIPVVLAIFDPSQVWPTLDFAFRALARTSVLLPLQFLR